jgi:uncharacterized protein YggT (Ycf19 family)
MHSRQRNEAENYQVLHNQNTEPVFTSITASMPIGAFPQESRWQRFLRGFVNCCKAIVRKINQMLTFALIVLLLILLTRFLLHLFGVTTGVNLFTQGLFIISDPLIAPFDHLFAPLLYQGYSIDITTSISIVVYTVSVVIVRQFLKLLVTKPR